jgi:hypothetical protein
LFPTLVKLKENQVIESSGLTICEKTYYSFEDDWKEILIYVMRVFAILVVFAWILYQIAVFLIGIYISYGNRFYIMSIIPALIMIFINFFVITNLMYLISSVIMYFFGFNVYKSKGLSITKVLFWIAVPSQGYYLHESIISFRDLHTKFLKKNKKI